MTAGVEGLPTDAHDRLAEALWLELVPGATAWPPPQQSLTDVYLRTADALLPVVADLVNEARAEELRAAAEAARGMHDPVAPDCAEWAGWLDARADALTAPQQQPTCQQRHTEGAYTWLCLQPAGHGDLVLHEDSAGHRW